MTAADWVALLGIALPLCIKAFAEFQSWLVLRKHTALANIVGMAGRQAASAARVLAALPAGVDAQTVERSLVRNATDTVLTEMKDSVAKVACQSPGSAQAKVQTIVQGELDKLVVAPIAVLPAPTPVIQRP
jgi:hypothetical protein